MSLNSRRVVIFLWMVRKYDDPMLARQANFSNGSIILLFNKGIALDDLYLVDESGNLISIGDLSDADFRRLEVWLDPDRWSRQPTIFKVNTKT